MKIRSVGAELSIRTNNQVWRSFSQFSNTLSKILSFSLFFAVSWATVAAALPHKHSSSPGIVFFFLPEFTSSYLLADLPVFDRLVNNLAAGENICSERLQSYLFQILTIHLPVYYSVYLQILQRKWTALNFLLC